ncbi:helix-turn-helix domain-containing protein [Streptomyces sp. NPDC001312]|uniref:helix-turn-helix domain-containing protein n=1 Tax=Streptomyces sp. NPDC001312 TaxID=3364561 RepID=UPI0036859756
MKKRLTRAARAVELRALIDSGQARDRRVLSGHTQAEAARYCEVSQAAIHRWERGERYPRGRNVDVYHRWLSRLVIQEAA